MLSEPATVGTSEARCVRIAVLSRALRQANPAAGRVPSRKLWETARVRGNGDEEGDQGREDNGQASGHASAIGT